MKLRYTTVDLAILAVIAAIFGAVFTYAWTPYYAIKAVGGKLVAVLLTYGIWYMAAPLAASIIKKPLAAFLGEFLAGFVESIMPQIGGFSGLIYAGFQGLFSEIPYLSTRYKSFGRAEAAVAGALPAIPSIALDILLWGSVYPPQIFAVLIVLAAISGAVYGVIAHTIAKTVPGKK